MRTTDPGFRMILWNFMTFSPIFVQSASCLFMRRTCAWMCVYISFIIYKQMFVYMYECMIFVIYVRRCRSVEGYLWYICICRSIYACIYEYITVNAAFLGATSLIMSLVGFLFLFSAWFICIYVSLLVRFCHNCL